MIAAVRVRGPVDLNETVNNTLDNINLNTKNQVVVFEENEAIMGMMNSVKDYITYGEISDEVVEKLEERKGESLESGDTVNLSPPSGGFEDTKRNTGQGGSLGKRENIDELLERMV
ncbi:MAG: uL30 family ribosomal protein [Nanohaloarchaea archaeon]|nr:uL30 family ribosomal protein [Candidatus Nanohaloarchaea archaeon]